jgi:hypothetical protein
VNAKLKPIEVPMPWDGLPSHLSWKEKVAFVGLRLLQLPQAGTSVEHSFGHGLYIRKMTIPARTVFLGRPHRHGHECTLLSGSVVLITPEGKRQIDAVKTIHTVPGFLMVLYALTDVVGQTVHPNPTDSHDTQALEDDIFESVESMVALGHQVAQGLLT